MLCHEFLTIIFIVVNVLMHDNQISVTAPTLASAQLTPIVAAAEATLHVCIDVSMVYVAICLSPTDESAQL